MQESSPFNHNYSESEKANHKRSAAEAVKRLLKMERKIEEKVENSFSTEYDEFSQAAKAAIQTFGFGGITQVPVADNTDDESDDESGSTEYTKDTASDENEQRDI